MSGDKLAVLLFFAAVAVAGVMAAIPLKGWQSRVMWALALVSGVATVVYLLAQMGSPAQRVLQALWSLSPLIAVSMVMVCTTQRVIPLRPKSAALIPHPPKLNPALTADYLNELVAGATELEAKRKVDALANQLTHLKAEIYEISEHWNGAVRAEVLGLQRRSKFRELDRVRVTFKRGQDETLERLKRGDWIEFQGELEHSSLSGWCVVRADFVGRAEPPPAPKPPRRRGRQPEAAA